MKESKVLEEEFDSAYEPTQDEILEYAQFLGIDINTEQDLLWIARESLKAPLPPEWKPCQTADESVYYFNFKTGESIWDHPCDEFYRNLYKEEKKKRNERLGSKKLEPIVKEEIKGEEVKSVSIENDKSVDVKLPDLPKQKEADIQKLEADIQAREDNLRLKMENYESLSKTQLEESKKLNDLAKSLDKREADLTSLENQLKSLDKDLKAREKTLSTNNEEYKANLESLAALKSSLKIREMDVDLKADKKAMADLQYREDELHSRESALKSRERDLEKSKAKNSEWEKEISKRGEEIVAKEEEIKSKEEELDFLKKTSGGVDEVEKRELAVKVKEGELKSREDILKSREGELRAREDILKSKEGELRAREDDLKTGESELKANENHLKAREAELKALEYRVKAGEEKSSIIGSENQTIAKKEKESKSREGKLKTQYDNQTMIVNEDELKSREEKLKTREEGLRIREEGVKIREDNVKILEEEFKSRQHRSPEYDTFQTPNYHDPHPGYSREYVDKNHDIEYRREAYQVGDGIDYPPYLSHNRHEYLESPSHNRQEYRDSLESPGRHEYLESPNYSTQRDTYDINNHYRYTPPYEEESIISDSKPTMKTLFEKIKREERNLGKAKEFLMSQKMQLEMGLQDRQYHPRRIDDREDYKIETQFHKLDKQKGNLDEIEKDLDQLLLVLHSEKKSFERKRIPQKTFVTPSDGDLGWKGTLARSQAVIEEHNQWLKSRI